MYEYTGALCGSLWILLVNILLFRLVLLVVKRDRMIVSFFSLICVVLVPIIVSRIIYSTYQEVDNKRNFTVLQPNIDPYNDKFGGLTQKEQTNILLSLIKDSDENKERVVLAPETFVGYEPPMIVEGKEKLNSNFTPFMEIIESSKMDLIVGAVTQRIAHGAKESTETTRYSGNHLW